MSERVEYQQLNVSGIGQVQATIVHHLRADGSVHLSELRAAISIEPPRMQLSEDQLKAVANAVGVFY